MAVTTVAKNKIIRNYSYIYRKFFGVHMVTAELQFGCLPRQERRSSK